MVQAVLLTAHGQASVVATQLEKSAARKATGQTIRTAGVERHRLSCLSSHRGHESHGPPGLDGPSPGCCFRQRASCAQATVASKFHGETQARPPRPFYPDLNSLRSAMGNPLNDFIPFKPFSWYSKSRLGVRSRSSIVFSVEHLSANLAMST